MSVSASFLRVYEPLSAFPPGRRALWQRALRSGKVPQRADAAWLEHRQAMAALTSGPAPDAPIGSDSRLARPHDAAPGDLLDLVLMDRSPGDGGPPPLLCPLRTRLRAWRSLREVRGDVPGAVLPALAPPGLVALAESELAAWQADGEDLRSHVREASWAVPLRWFAVVAESERVTRLGPRHVGQGLPGPEAQERSVVFRTRMGQARRRVARAHEVLEEHVDDVGAVEGMAELGRWLGSFDPRSTVELDYGGLVHALDDDDLTQDTSAADVAGALAALARGDAVVAARCYDEVTERWGGLQAREVAN